MMEFNGNPHQFLNAPSINGQYNPRFAGGSWCPQYYGIFPQSGGFPGRGRGVISSQFGDRNVYCPPRLPPVQSRTPSLWTMNSRQLDRRPQQGTFLLQYQRRSINHPLGSYRGHYRFQGIDQIAKASPRFHPKNMRQVASHLTGFVYCN